MTWSNEELKTIYRRTDGRCHLCGKKLSLANYAAQGSRGAWEVEHSNPSAAGGTDRLNNLYPACISCNREKRDGSTRAARARHGRTRAPLSREKKTEVRVLNSLSCGALGAAVGGVIGGPPGAIIGGGIGALVGSALNPE
jgi:hypothetical protein